jgi:uncharacterized protein YcbX
MTANVKEILITHEAGEDLYSIDVASLVAGKGIEGDRYFHAQGTFTEALQESKDFEVTLIEQEEIDAFNQEANLNYSNQQFRRNIVTQGVRLNDLVGKEVSMGATTLKIIRLCEPCAYLTEILGPKLMEHMVHKAGIRAVITVSGQVRVGDTLKAL